MKKTFNFVKKACSFILGLISALSFFFQINSFKQIVTNEKITKIIYSEAFLYTMLVVFIFSFIALIISIYIVSDKENQTSTLFHLFYHNLRDKRFMIAQTEIKKQSEYNSYIKKFSVDFCTTISDYFKAKYSKDFRICIKMIDIPSSTTTTSIKEMKVYTLARRNEDIDKNQPNDPSVSVETDTSYMKILAEGHKSFACTNLIFYSLFCKLIKRNPYLPPLKTFIKRYKSTVVVPIRIESDHLPDSHRFGTTKFTGFQVFGFLCLDYKHIMTKKLAKELSLELRGFADGLYMFFDEVLIKTIELSEKETITK